MMNAIRDLPRDMVELPAMPAASLAGIEARDAEIGARDLPIGKLKHQLAGMRRHRFGARSEALDRLDLSLEDAEIAGAIRQAPTRLKRLGPHPGHGLPDLDSNAAERTIRPLASGRKNDLFTGSGRGGRAAAIACTLIGTARLDDIDPQAWPSHALDVVADHPVNRIEELLPRNRRAAVTDGRPAA